MPGGARRCRRSATDGAAGSAAGTLAGPAAAGLAATLAAAALIRPGDAISLGAALLAAAIAVPAWRRWPLLTAVVTGLTAGCLEWVAEAYARFGGPLERLHVAGAEQGGLGLHLGLWDELRALNGPTLCRPCTVGWRQPELSLWWLVLPVLVVAGILAARQAGRLASALLPAVCALGMASQYLFLISYAAPRFLLPAYALAALPVADALAWLSTSVRADLRPVTTGLVTVFLALQLLAQHLVLDHEVGGTITFHNDYARIVADLRRLNVRPPCLIKGEQFIPIAFDAGCASAPGARQALARPAPGTAGLSCSCIPVPGRPAMRAAGHGTRCREPACSRRSPTSRRHDPHHDRDGTPTGRLMRRRHGRRATPRVVLAPSRPGLRRHRGASGRPAQQPSRT